MGNVCECQRPDVCTSTGDRVKVESPQAPDDTKTATPSPVVQFTDDDLDSESDGDSDVIEDIPQPSQKAQAKNRQSVSAEAYGEWNKRQNFKAPVYPKTDEQKVRINAVLENSFLFSALDVEEIDVLLDAFEEVHVTKGTTIIKQGDDGDKLYLIETGIVDVFKKFSDTEEAVKVTEMVPGDAFGELALMYNAPRAATVVAQDEMLLWALDRESFSHIVKDAAAKKREMFEVSLKEVSLLKDIDPYERSKVADALKTLTFQPDDTIIKEGEAGDTFYMIMEGDAEAIKEGKPVMQYTKGGHFGELALLKNQPRAATVRAKTVCKVAYMDRKSFKRLLGPVEALLARNQDHYRSVMKEMGMDTTYLDK